MLKIYLLIAKQKKLLSINEIIINFYQYTEERYPKFIVQLNKKLKYCIVIINIMIKIFFSSAFIFGIYPFLLFFYTWRLQLPFGFILPGLNYNKFPGFQINYLFHLLQIYLVALGVTGTDGICLLYVYNGCLQIEAIIFMLAEIDNLLDSYDNNKQEIETILNNIIETHQIQRRYILHF